MNKKITATQVVTIGLLSTTLAFTRLEVVNSKRSPSPVALQLNMGEPASAVKFKCTASCARQLIRTGGKVIRSISRDRNQQQQQQQE